MPEYQEVMDRVKWYCQRMESPKATEVVSDLLCYLAYRQRAIEEEEQICSDCSKLLASISEDLSGASENRE